MKSKNDIKVCDYARNISISLRKKAGIRQQDLGDFLGISRTAMVNIEAGRQNLSASMIYILACLYNVEIAYFFPKKRKVKLATEEVKVKIIKQIEL